MIGVQVDAMMEQMMEGDLACYGQHEMLQV